MKRKNFILTILVFLFINILSMGMENPITPDKIGIVDPAFQEALADYKPNLENIDKIFDYIEKNIKEKGKATYYTKLIKEKNEMVVTDENNKLIYNEKIPESIGKLTPYVEIKQTYQLKNGKTLNYSEMNTEISGKKVKIKSESLMKRKINKKDAIKNLNLMGDLSNAIKNSYSNIEYLRLQMYDENNNLMQTINYKNNKMIVEQEIEGHKIKMIYHSDDANFVNGKVETYMNDKLFSTMQMKNSLPEGEAKIFYPNGKLLSISNIKNGKIEGMMKIYYENSKIMMTVSFKDGVQDGETIAYDEDGTVVKKVLYKNGKIVK